MIWLHAARVMDEMFAATSGFDFFPLVLKNSYTRFLGNLLPHASRQLRARRYAPGDIM